MSHILNNLDGVRRKQTGSRSHRVLSPCYIPGSLIVFFFFFLLYNLLKLKKNDPIIAENGPEYLQILSDFSFTRTPIFVSGK